jgi:lipopolysaccharide biosynthesis protein
MTKWQFQDFCKENPKNNEEFRHTVQKMITAEEKTW